MFVIKLKDNDYKGTKISLTNLSDEEKKCVRKILDSINNVSIKDLEARGIIVFPSKSVESELNDSNKMVCCIQNLESETPIIQTTNVMGYFSFGNCVQMEITSRFDDDERQFFLHYILQKVCNVSPTLELTYANENPFYEFLVYLLPSFLKRAVAQGVFRHYIYREYNDSNIRGVIDFSRHIRNNIPFNGKVAYRTREYSQNNYLTQLIRHTIEFVAENKKLNSILSLDEEIRDVVGIIRGCTESYEKLSRDFIINKNLIPVTHPYYTEYEPLRKLCIMILTHNKISYGEVNQNPLNGIVFDGASLWEEYLNVIMKEKIIEQKYKYILDHPNNRTGQARKYLFETEDEKNAVAIYPDFMVKDLNHNIFAIIDAKYKNLKDGIVAREDYFQVLTYLFRFRCNRGVLVHPCNESEWNVNCTKRYLKEHNEIISFETYGFPIPNFSYVENGKIAYKSFCEKMRECEKNLIINNLFQ